MPPIAVDPGTGNIPVSHPDFGAIPSALPVQGPGMIPNSVPGIMAGQISGIMTGPGVMQSMLLHGMGGPQNIPRTPNQFADQGEIVNFLM